MKFMVYVPIIPYDEIGPNQTRTVVQVSFFNACSGDLIERIMIHMCGSHGVSTLLMAHKDS